MATPRAPMAPEMELIYRLGRQSVDIEVLISKLKEKDEDNRFVSKALVIQMLEDLRIIRDAE